MKKKTGRLRLGIGLGIGGSIGGVHRDRGSIGIVSGLVMSTLFLLRNTPPPKKKKKKKKLVRKN